MVKLLIVPFFHNQISFVLQGIDTKLIMPTLHECNSCALVQRHIGWTLRLLPPSGNCGCSITQYVLHKLLPVSRFGVIPIPHQPGKWRLIVDLSYPKGASVNDGIDPDLCSLVYTLVDEAVNRVLQHGQGAQLAKLDIASAYRIIPVYPDDRPLLAMSWNQQLLVDTALPFGLRSAPKIAFCIIIPHYKDPRGVVEMLAGDVEPNPGPSKLSAQIFHVSIFHIKFCPGNVRCCAKAELGTGL